MVNRKAVRVTVVNNMATTSLVNNMATTFLVNNMAITFLVNNMAAMLLVISNIKGHVVSEGLIARP